ncbi:MAG: hypothetical protein JSS21_00920, partial [Proteobacteria bacterium]|nr:hypothetical protein [Pseudomonadota bacterium]
MSALPVAMDAHAEHRLRIALSELEPGDAELFQAALQRLEERLSHRWEWADLAHADVTIVDMDSLFGHMAWLKAHGAGKQVITFARTRPHGSDLVLDKPLEDDAFAAVLEQAAGHIDGSENARRPMQAARSIPPVAPAQPAVAKAEFPAHPPSESAGVMDLAAAGDIVTAQVAMPEVAEPAQPAEPEPRNVAEMLARRRIDQPVRVG